MRWEPQTSDLRIISAFLIGLVVGMAAMVVVRDFTERKPVYAVRETTQTRGR